MMKENTAVKKKYGPYKYDQIVTAMEKVVNHLWDDCERADQQCRSRDMEFAEYPGCDKDIELGWLFDEVKVLKWLVNQSCANRNAHDFFGHCPECGGNDGRFNIGRCNYFCCKLCKNKWLRGENLLSSWRHESEEDWAKNEAYFREYREVDPVFDWSQREEVR